MSVSVRAAWALAGILSALLFSSSVQALDASAAVQVTPLLKTTRSWDGQPIKYPEGNAEITALTIELAANGETGWHEHAVPSFAYIVEGELEVRRSDGSSRIFKAGEALAEVVNTLHNGRALNGKPVKLVVFYAGSVGQRLTTAHPEFKLETPAQ